MIRIYLAEERSRLGLKAKDVADHAGIAIPTQSNYEKGKRYPDAHYFYKIAELGFDINYVVTGQRNKFFLSNQEKLLIELYREASESVKSHILSGLISNGHMSGSGNSVTVGNDNKGNVAGGNINIK